MYGEIAAGGMASVCYGRLLGPVGFSRTVAIKRLHPHLASDPEFVAMLLDEARLAARIHHPNVVQTLDVVAREGELFLVLDYVQGESLSRLVGAARKRGRPIPIGVVSAILCGALHGLHAAHEATNEHGEPLGIVHRDVSPQNVLVGGDGVPRVLDFGIAKASGRVNTTREGQLKGKLAYMAPEQLHGALVDRRTDVYAAGVLLWEALTLRRLFAGDSEAAVVQNALSLTVQPPGSLVRGVPPGVDEVVMRALQRDATKRFASAESMAMALEACVTPASASRVGAWVHDLAGEVLAMRATSVAQIESDSSTSLLTVPSDGPGDETSSIRHASVPTKIEGRWGGNSRTSMVSVSTNTAEPPPPSKRRSHVLIAAVAATVVAIVTAALAAVNIRTDRGATAAQAAAVTAQSSRPPVASTSALFEARAPDPTAAAAPVATSAWTAVQPTAAAESPPTTVRSVAAPKAIPVRAPVTSKPALAPATASSAVTAEQALCPVKTFVDESGIKHYKRECN